MLTKYPNLPLFLLVYKHFWSSQGYHFQFMPHMEDKETTLMHNLTSVLILKCGDNVKTYFLPEDVEAAKDKYWDKNIIRVMCKIDENISETRESDAISLNLAL